MEQEEGLQQGKKPERTEKQALDPDLGGESKMEVGAPFSRAQVANDRDGCRGLDKGSSQGWSHFQLHLPGPSWPPGRHNLTHKTCFFCAAPMTEQVLDPGKRRGAGTPAWETLAAMCPGEAAGWLWEGVAPYGRCTTG